MTVIATPRRLIVRGDLQTRLLARRLIEIAEDGIHWLWTGGCSKKGYGTIREGPRGSRMLYVHRVSYELFVGPIPDGHEIDHECERTRCFNPTCLSPVLPHLNNYYRNHGRLQTAVELERVDDMPYEHLF